MNSVDHDHAVVLGVGAQRHPAAHHEIQRPLEGIPAQLAVASGAPHLVKQGVGIKAQAWRQVGQRLGQRTVAVSGQRAHRGDPQQTQRRRAVLPGDGPKTGRPSAAARNSASSATA